MKRLIIVLLFSICCQNTLASGSAYYVYIIKKDNYSEEMNINEIQKNSEAFLPCGISRIAKCSYSLIVNGEVTVNLSVTGRSSGACNMNLTKTHDKSYPPPDITDPNVNPPLISKSGPYYRDFQNPENSIIDENFKYVCGIAMRRWGAQR